MAKRSSGYIIHLRAKNDELKRKLKESQDAVRKHTTAMKMADQQLRSLTALAGGFFSAMALKSFAQSTIEITKKQEQLNFALKAVTESQEEFERKQRLINKVAEESGIVVEDLVSSYVKFNVAAKGTKLEGEAADQIFQKMTKSAAVLGLRSDEVAGIIRALEQMMSKGKVQAEELRLQLGDRLPGAFSAMANAAGVSRAELSKMMEEGKVITEDVLPAFADEILKAFGADKVAKVDTMVAAQNRFTNAWRETIAALNETGVIERAYKAILNLGTIAMTPSMWGKDPALYFGLLGQGASEASLKIAKFDGSLEQQSQALSNLKLQYEIQLKNTNVLSESYVKLKGGLDKVTEAYDSVNNKIAENVSKQKLAAEEAAEVAKILSGRGAAGEALTGIGISEDNPLMKMPETLAKISKNTGQGLGQLRNVMSSGMLEIEAITTKTGEVFQEIQLNYEQLGNAMATVYSGMIESVFDGSKKLGEALKEGAAMMLKGVGREFIAAAFQFYAKAASLQASTFPVPNPAAGAAFALGSKNLAIGTALSGAGAAIGGIGGGFGGGGSSSAASGSARERISIPSQITIRAQGKDLVSVINANERFNRG